MRQNIAIDGPAGAGKSTIAKRVAKLLGSVYVDTGAMYRAIAIFLLNKGFTPESLDGIEAYLPEAEVTIAYEDGAQQVFLNGENVTGSLRREEVGNMASASSAKPAVRAKLLDLQRSLAEKTDVVMDGRDIGTVVLPDAFCKIFLTASVEKRAERRFIELTEKGEHPDLAKIAADIAERDERDANRAAAPLKQAEDALLVDSTDLSIEEVTERILRIFLAKADIRIAESAGFCFGVRRAVQMVNDCIVNGKKPVYTLGPIIHNEMVVREFEEKGVITLPDENALEGIGGGTVVIRSHGVSREVMEKLSHMDVEIVDATCPFVSKIHDIVAEASRDGEQVLIIGDPDHPEVKGTVGYSETPCIVVQSREDLLNLRLPENTRLCVVAQTTFNLQKFKELVEITDSLEYDKNVHGTVCHATDERQSEAGNLAASSDIMLVLGSGTSSNTRKLYEICRERCEHTYYIQSLVDMDSIRFRSDSCVGITAGASTPYNFIQEVSLYVRRAKL